MGTKQHLFYNKLGHFGLRSTSYNLITYLFWPCPTLRPLEWHAPRIIITLKL